MIIDCHTHLNRYEEGQWASLGDRYRQLKSDMARHGVDYSLVLSSFKTPAGLLEFPPSLLPVSQVEVAVPGQPQPLPLFKVAMPDGGVREATRIVVNDAIRALNYTPNLMARSLVTSREIRIGVIYDYTGPFAAGAVSLGKTNVPEFGYSGVGHNPVFETTRKPWNLERTPGGSSAGSGAAAVPL